MLSVLAVVRSRVGLLRYQRKMAKYQKFIAACLADKIRNLFDHLLPKFGTRIFNCRQQFRQKQRWNTRDNCSGRNCEGEGR